MEQSSQVGNEDGDQFNGPSYIFVDQDYSLYVSDTSNHRVMKWIKDTKEGIVVADGNEQEDQSNQLSHSKGLSFDRQGHLYVADWGNAPIRKFEVD